MKDKILSSNMEDYLEVIYLLEKKNKVARITDIANMLNVSKPSVSKALHVLGEQNYVNYEPYKFITLKAKGKDIAKRTLRKHEGLEDFFSEILFLEEKESGDIACEFEHIIDCKILDKFKKLHDFISDDKSIMKKWKKIIEKD